MSIKLKVKNESPIQKWAVCCVASLFFFYEFIQINMFNSIDPEIVKAFKLNATQLGLLSACYFYSTVGFLLPAGQILDRYSVKKVILVTLLLCIVGIVGFLYQILLQQQLFFVSLKELEVHSVF